MRVKPVVSLVTRRLLVAACGGDSGSGRKIRRQSKQVENRE